MMRKIRVKDTIYWYEAVPGREGTWDVQKVSQGPNGTRVSPVATGIEEWQAKGAVGSGSPLRFLGPGVG